MLNAKCQERRNPYFLLSPRFGYPFGICLCVCVCFCVSLCGFENYFDRICILRLESLNRHLHNSWKWPKYFSVQNSKVLLLLLRIKNKLSVLLNLLLIKIGTSGQESSDKDKRPFAKLVVVKNKLRHTHT